MEQRLGLLKLQMPITAAV